LYEHSYRERVGVDDALCIFSDRVSVVLSFNVSICVAVSVDIGVFTRIDVVGLLGLSDTRLDHVEHRVRSLDRIGVCDPNADSLRNRNGHTKCSVESPVVVCARNTVDCCVECDIAICALDAVRCAPEC
jgi:hypothetical protein